MYKLFSLKNRKIFLSLLVLFALNMGITAQVYTLNMTASTTNSAFGGNNAYAAKTGTVGDVTWYINAGSCQGGTNGVWLGTNNATNRTNLAKLEVGLNGRGDAIATALGIASNVEGYYAMAGMNDIEDVKSVTVQAGSLGGTAPANMWCLYSTDNGATYTILEGVKNTPGTTLVTFTALSTIESAQYAFVWYSSAFGTYRSAEFNFWGDEVVYTITPARNDPSGGTVSLFGNVITATPAACYTFGDPVWEVTPMGAAEVSRSGNNFTVSDLTDNVTVTFNFVELPIYNVMFKNEGETHASAQTVCGKITLPTATTSECVDWDFIGWAKTSVSETPTKPTVYGAGSVYTPTADNEIMYAVYSKLATGTVDNYTPDETAQQFVIASKVGDTYNALPTGTFNNGTRVTNAITTNISNGVVLVTNVDAAGYIWAIEDIGSNDFTISYGANYLKAVADNNTGINCNTTTPEYWAIETGTTGSYRVRAKSFATTTRGLGLNTTATNYVMGYYATSNLNNLTSGYYDVELLPINDVTFTYNSNPACCVAPTVKMEEITFDGTDFTAKAIIINDGGCEVTNWGVIYGLSPNPTTDDEVVGKDEFSEIIDGSFSIDLDNLAIYNCKVLYFRAYAENEAGISYSDVYKYVENIEGDCFSILVDNVPFDGGIINFTANSTKVFTIHHAVGFDIEFDGHISFTGPNGAPSRAAADIPNQQITITYAPAPTEEGTHDATLMLTSDDTTIPQMSIALVGTASDVTVGVKNPQIVRIIYTIGNTLVVNAQAGETIEILNVLGQPLTRLIAQNGETRINVPSGVLLVRIAGTTAKVVVK